MNRTNMLKKNKQKKYNWCGWKSIADTCFDLNILPTYKFFLFIITLSVKTEIKLYI